jgi:hypothetical protein
MENILNLAKNEISKLKTRISQLEEENQKLTEDLTQAKTSPFKKLFSKKQPPETPRKRGPPFGHPGTSRKKPASIDEYVTVTLQKCPDCGSLDISVCKHFDTHTQEDIVIVKTIKRCFIHLNYWCPHCKKSVYSFADNELPHSPIGPTAKAVACFLHYQIKVSYDDVQKIFQNLFGLTLSPGSLVGFDNKLYQQALPLYESIRKMLPYTPNIHADETSWKNGWLWTFTNKLLAYYHIDKHRSGRVVQEHLGADYKGILTTDFFSSYNSSINAFAKQKCSAHLLRSTEELEEEFPDDSIVISFCQELKTLIQDAILLHSQFSNLTTDLAWRKTGEWENLKKPLFSHLNELSQTPVPHPKADTLRKRLLKHKDEILTFLNYPEIEPTNNMAERALRNLVMLRKITFGNRSEQGEKNVSSMATILQTSKLKGLNQIEVLQTLLTKGLTDDLAQKFDLPQTRAP